MNNDIYVIVCDNDKPQAIGGEDFFDDGGPIVIEQYVNQADLESIQARAKQITKYGKTRIAKLVFINE